MTRLNNKLIATHTLSHSDIFAYCAHVAQTSNTTLSLVAVGNRHSSTWMPPERTEIKWVETMYLSDPLHQRGYRTRFTLCATSWNVPLSFQTGVDCVPSSKPSRRQSLYILLCMNMVQCRSILFVCLFFIYVILSRCVGVCSLNNLLWPKWLIKIIYILC